MRYIPFNEFARKLHVECESSQPISGFQIDSRQVLPGEVFFALKGERVDGHSFLFDVKSKGAIAAVVSERYLGPNFGLQLLPVQDVTKTLQVLAREEVISSQAKIIGITGSVGKTTTKEFISELLQAKYKVFKTPGNFNTKLSLPLSILNREGGEEVFVLEMGMSEPGDLTRLVSIAPPEIAIVTKVALAHSAYFEDGIEGIARGKAEIFKSAKLEKAVFFQELSKFRPFQEIGSEKITFSMEDRSADYFLLQQDERYALDERGIRTDPFELPFHEEHLLHNFLAAIATARQMKLSWDEIHARILFLKAPKMRFEKCEKKGALFFNDTYNANPESMKAAFMSLPEPQSGGKRIGVLGTMSPLGSFSKNAHEEIGRLATTYFDLLFVYGEEALPFVESFLEAKKTVEYFTDLQSLASRLDLSINPGDVVLVKGSRIMKMEKLFEML